MWVNLCGPIKFLLIPVIGAYDAESKPIVTSHGYIFCV
jgi:hypothetical protein